jgi:hypothetical protein
MKDTGGPAFPQCSYNLKGGYDITGGLSLRDYFAAKAMQGMLARKGQFHPADAYEYADAMLAERSKT